MNILLRTTSVGRRAYPLTDADTQERMNKGSIEFVRHKVYREITKSSAPPEPAKNPAAPPDEPEDDTAQTYQTRDMTAATKRPTKQAKKPRARPSRAKSGQSQHGKQSGSVESEPTPQG